MALDLPSAQELLDERRPEVFSTRSLWLDLAVCASAKRVITDPKLGTCGIPGRSICEVYGLNQTGKTLLAEMVARSVLERDPSYEVMMLLAEEPNVTRMKNNGLDLSRIKVWSFLRNEKALKKDPTGFVTSEEGLDLALEYVRTIRPDVKTKGKDGKEIVIPGKKTKLVVIDSLAALVSSTETDGKKAGEVRSFNENDLPAVRARLLKRFLLDWVAMNNNDAILIMTNLVSEAIGSDFTFGPSFKDKTPAGRFKEGVCTLRIKSDSVPVLAEKSSLTNVEDMIGLELFYTIKKNKHAVDSNIRRAITKFYFDSTEFDRASELFSLGNYLEVITSESKGYYKVPGREAQIHGAQATEDFINENPEVAKAIEKQVIAKAGLIYGRGKDKKNKLRASEALAASTT